MSSINNNLLFQNILDWQSSSSNKKTGSSNTVNDLASLLQADKLNGVTDFNSIFESLKDPSKAAALTSRSVEGYSEYNLKAAFKTESGQNINLELNVKVSFKFEQATVAYAKNKKHETDAGDEFSPENTAKRITDFAMGFLSSFQSNHADQTKKDSVNGFFDLAKNAISKGFDQAKSILGDLYGETGESTYDLVMKYLDTAQSNLLGTDKISPASDSSQKIKS